jgi:Xaa-Pro aminopeptidase
MTIANRPTIPAGTYVDRLGRLAELARRRSVDGVILSYGADLAYLTGYAAMPSERLTALTVGARSATPVMIVPRLEEPAAKAGLGTDIAIETWLETEDPYRKVLGRFEDHADGPVEIAISDRMWALHVLRFQERLAGATWSSATALLRELRMVKDADEIALLRLAAHAADRVVAQIAAGRLVGRTEADVAREVHDRLIAEGHDTAEFGIVGSGPNSASPHHQASDRVIEAGEPIVLDIGGILGRYCSDTTRTLWVTGGDPAKGPTEEFRHLFGILQTAQERATAAVRPGVACEAIDAAARDVIDAEGYGEAFFHRTGHGIGLEGHEEPYVIAGNDEPLRPGIAFSVEPGIYLAGRFGARIEDIVVCGPDGPDTLNVSPRELYVVDG